MLWSLVDFLYTEGIVMKPLYNYNDRVLLYHGDMMEVLPSLGMRFGHCITDPPYGVQRENNFDTMGRTGCTFGEWDERDVVVSQLPAWIECMCRFTDGNMVVFNDWHNLGMISTEMNRNGYEDKDVIIWKKTNPMPRNVDRRFVPCVEYALWCTKKNVKWTFNRGVATPYEIPVMECDIERKDDFNDHTTSKPLRLMDKIVSLLTNEDDWLLDPFGGSGTIALSCIRLNRRLVLIEQNRHYCDIIMRRIENATRQLFLF